MKSDRLIKEMKNIDSELVRLKTKKAEIKSVILNGISFNSKDLRESIRYLVYLRENDIHYVFIKHSKNLTFNHLLEKYNISYEEWPGRIQFSNFKWSYIKDFIYYLADLQIEKSSSLSYEEIFDAVDDFNRILNRIEDGFNDTSDIPKTKVLKRN